MIIQMIKQKNCPVCDSATVAERKSLRHTNGYWNEEREFTCGARLKFSPNFMRVEDDKLRRKLGIQSTTHMLYGYLVVYFLLTGWIL